MRLERARNLIALLEERLRPDAGAPADPLIESVVVNYMLTVIYADLEQAVRDEIARYADEGPDARIATFVSKSAKRVVRSIKCNELAGTLAMFDDPCKKHFQEQVNDTPAQVAYDRVVGGRHEQAHAGGSSMSWDDMKRDVDHCEVVMQAFGDALRCACSHP